MREAGQSAPAVSASVREVELLRCSSAAVIMSATTVTETGLLCHLQLIHSLPMRLLLSEAKVQAHMGRCGSAGVFSIELQL